jgi:hypothetical protein
MDDAAIPQKWLGAPIADLDELVAANRATVTASWFLADHPELDGSAPLDFGYCHLEWSKLRAQMCEGDQLFEYSSLIAEGGVPAEAGVALVRQEIPIAYVETVQFHRQFDWRLVDLTFTSRPERENWDDGSEKPISFEYFSAPPSEMYRLRIGRKECGYCDESRMCFSLDGEVTLGCVKCLQKGRFEWLICCKDFMTYVGDWTPAHFHYLASNGDGKALFQRIAGDECRSWWDDVQIRILGGHSPASWGESLCHVFRCRHCRSMRLYFAFS